MLAIRGIAGKPRRQWQRASTVVTLSLSLLACQGEADEDPSSPDGATGGAGATSTPGGGAAAGVADDERYSTPGLERITNSGETPYSLLDSGDYLYQAKLELSVDRCEKKPGGQCTHLFDSRANTFSHPSLAHFGSFVTFVDAQRLYWYDEATGEQGTLPDWEELQTYVRAQEHDGLLYVMRGYCEELLVYDHDWNLVAHHFPVALTEPDRYNYAPGFLIAGDVAYCAQGGFDRVYTIDLESGEAQLYLDFGVNDWGGALINLLDWDGRLVSTCSGPSVSYRIIELLGPQQARFLTDAEGPGPHVFSLSRDGGELWVFDNGPTRHDLSTGEVWQASRLYFGGQRASVYSGFLDGDYAYLGLEFDITRPDMVFGGVFRIRKDQLQWEPGGALSKWWPDQPGFVEGPDGDGSRDWLVE